MFETFELLQKLMRNSHHILRQNLEPYGLYKGQPKILKLLSMHDGLSKKEIASHYDVAMPTITKTVERLQNNGFIYSKLDESDKRVTRVFLTEKGRVTHLELKTFKKQYADIVFKDVSEEDLDEFTRVLSKLLENIEEYKVNNEKTD